MNILAIAHYQNDSSPCAIFIHEQMKAFVNIGNRVRVIVPIAIGKKGHDEKRIGFGIKNDVIDGIEYFFVRYLSLSHYGEYKFNAKSAILSILIYLPKILKSFYPDIIHAHTFGFDSDIGAWLKKRFEIPLVVTTHGSDTSLLVENKEYKRLKEYADKAGYIVAVSTALANKLKLCATDTPISVILNGFAIQHMHNNLNKMCIRDRLWRARF